MKVRPSEVYLKQLVWNWKRNKDRIYHKIIYIFYAII
jgi:hypothetical protein